MIFTSDPKEARIRANAVRDLLPTAPEPAGLVGGYLVVMSRWQTGAGEVPVIFNALEGVITFQDLDGELRRVSMPAGITSDAVADMMTALGDLSPREERES